MLRVPLLWDLIHFWTKTSTDSASKKEKVIQLLHCLQNSYKNIKNNINSNNNNNNCEM